MREIDISISTIARPENYLDITLRSLGSDIPVNLIVGSTSMSYLDIYRRSKQHTIVYATEFDWANVHNMPIRQRASWNYWRCLTSNIKHNNGAIIFEDDINAAKGWRTRLDKTIESIENIYGMDYVLALYSHCARDSYKQGLFFENYIVRDFFGTPGMYFTEKTRIGYADYIRKFGVETCRRPYDLLIKHYLVENDIRLFATTPSLVQHIGISSTGLSEIFYQAPSFLEDVTSLPER
ncbi:MAG TPA: hypothetical protein VGU46_04660 [Acidobacteriaceae bacterium]|nr:hypothetical protein [Acidobacteriaceae bacterium]